MKNNEKTKNLAQMSIIAAIYIAVSLMLSGLSFGAIQIRPAEMFNHLAIYKKKYIIAIAIAVFIVNLFSPLGVIDVVVGTLSTLLTMTSIHYVTKMFKNEVVKYVASTILGVVLMFPIAIEVAYIYHLPFLITYLTIMLGEFIAMGVGGFVMYEINKRIKF